MFVKNFMVQTKKIQKKLRLFHQKISNASRGEMTKEELLGIKKAVDKVIEAKKKSC